MVRKIIISPPITKSVNTTGPQIGLTSESYTIDKLNSHSSKCFIVTISIALTIITVSNALKYTKQTESHCIVWYHWLGLGTLYPTSKRNGGI